MSYSDNNSYEQILERTLANPILAEVDKRVGSVIYDALAPLCMELAEAYIKMDILEEQTYLMTATGENLDKRCYDYGVKRIEATQAKRIGSFKTYEKDSQGNVIYYDEGGHVTTKDKGNPKLIDMEIPVGSRFSLPNDSSLFYTYTGHEDEHKILLCEQFGVKGNSYEGVILPINTIDNLIECKIVGTYQPANDAELDVDLRQRTKDTVNHRSFGGNIQDYVEKLKAIRGVGNCKIFPAWRHNGSVLISVVDTQYNPATEDFQRLIKKELDPEELTGQGRGIAPIGHYVTVTAPVKKMVKISIKVSLTSDTTIGMVREAIEREIETYFNLERRKFKQDAKLSIYLAKIIDVVLNVPDVLNVSSVLLNDKNEDIIYTDEDDIGKQYLPYVQEVVIG